MYAGIKQDKRMIERIDRLIREIQREPFAGIGKLEALKHAPAGFWSSRITGEHRIVHRVEDDPTNHLKARYPINPSYTARSFSEKQQKTTFSLPGQLFSVLRTVSTAIFAAWSTG